MIRNKPCAELQREFPHVLNRATVLAVIVLICGIAGDSAAVAAELAAETGNWPQWRGPNRDGISTDTGLLQDWSEQEPVLVWQSEGFGSGYASVSVVGDRIYTTGNFAEGQCVVAAKLSDGRVEWKKPITEKSPEHGYKGSRCTPTFNAGRLYAVASGGSIACLDAASGTVKWEQAFRPEWGGRMMSSWGFSESPLVDGDRVLCTPGGAEAMVVALDKLTGEEIWRSAVPDGGPSGKDGAGYSSIVISKGGGVKQYVQLIGRGLIGVRASDGKLLWRYDRVANGTANIPTPIVSGDYVFSSTGYRTGSALVKLIRDGDGVRAEEQYFLEARTLQNHHGGLLLIGDYIYCGHGHGEGFPICVNLYSGEVVWGGKLRGVGNGSAAIAYADGHLVFRYQSGEIALIEATPEEYRLKGALKPAYQERYSFAHPVITGGRLYLREQNVMMCYDMRAR